MYSEIVLLEKRVYAPLLYLIVAVPMFVAASISFALTGKTSSYFKPFHNLRLIITHPFHFLWFLLLLGALTLVVSYLAWIPIIVPAAWVWITAYLAGTLAAEIRGTTTIDV